MIGITIGELVEHWAQLTPQERDLTVILVREPPVPIRLNSMEPADENVVQVRGFLTEGSLVDSQRPGSEVSKVWMIPSDEKVYVLEGDDDVAMSVDVVLASFGTRDERVPTADTTIPEEPAPEMRRIDTGHGILEIPAELGSDPRVPDDFIDELAAAIARPLKETEAERLGRELQERSAEVAAGNRVKRDYDAKDLVSTAIKVPRGLLEQIAAEADQRVVGRNKLMIALLESGMRHLPPFDG